jgi:hypothetical protein
MCCKIVKRLIVVPPDEYFNKPTVRSRTHKLFVALPGNTRQYECNSLPTNLPMYCGYPLNTEKRLYNIVTYSGLEWLIIMGSGFDENRDIVDGITTCYSLDDRGVGVRVPVGKKFSLLHIVQTVPGVYPTPYKMGNGASFLGGKAAGTCSWPLTSS